MSYRIPERRQVAPACAICAADILDGAPLREPLGRNGALVDVCTGCATERPIAREPIRCYTGGEGAALGAAEMKAAIVELEGGKEAYAANVKRRRRAGNAFKPAMSKSEQDILAVVREGKRRRATGAARSR